MKGENLYRGSFVALMAMVSFASAAGTITTCYTANKIISTGTPNGECIQGLRVVRGLKETTQDVDDMSVWCEDKEGNMASARCVNGGIGKCGNTRGKGTCQDY